jgi:hypothetical protein
MNTRIPHSATLLCYDPFVSTLLADKRNKVQNGQEGFGIEGGACNFVLSKTSGSVGTGDVSREQDSQGLKLAT